MPLPNAVDPARSYNALIQATVDQPRRDSILRIDWNIGPRTQFYWRGINDYEAYKGEFDFVLASSSWPQLPLKYQIRSAGSVATLIHTFSPTRINEFTFGVNRAKQTHRPAQPGGSGPQHPLQDRPESAAVLPGCQSVESDSERQFRRRAERREC